LRPFFVVSGRAGAEEHKTQYPGRSNQDNVGANRQHTPVPASLLISRFLKERPEGPSLIRLLNRNILDQLDTILIGRTDIDADTPESDAKSS